MSYPTTMAEAEAMDFDQQQHTPVASRRERGQERDRTGRPDRVDTSSMTREERNAIPPELRRPTRGMGRHWEERAFRATFQGYTFEYDRHTIERKRFIVLSDVYMDGSLLTLNWRLPECAALLRMIGEVGQPIEFEAQINRTGKEAREAGQPVLRGPFRNMATKPTPDPWHQLANTVMGWADVVEGMDEADAMAFLADTVIPELQKAAVELVPAKVAS